MVQGRADAERLFALLRAQPSRRYARDIFDASGAMLFAMGGRERERVYEVVDRILDELPSDD